MERHRHILCVRENNSLWTDKTQAILQYLAERSIVPSQLASALCLTSIDNAVRLRAIYFAVKYADDLGLELRDERVKDVYNGIMENKYVGLPLKKGGLLEIAVRHIDEHDPSFYDDAWIMFEGQIPCYEVMVDMQRCGTPFVTGRETARLKYGR